MATQVQIRRGTTAQHAAFTGAAGELTVDSDKKVVVVHDGTTAGGVPMLRQDQSNLQSTAPANGIYLPSSNTLGFSTASTSRLVVDASGNVNIDAGTFYVDAVNSRVGIGTATPGSSFELSGSGSACEMRLRSTDTTNAIIRAYVNSLEAGKIAFTSGRNLFIETAGSERLRLDASGNVNIDSGTFYVDAVNNRVGIGTTGPAQALHLKGSGDVKLLINSTNNASDRGIYFAASTDSDVLGYIKQEYSTGKFEISSGSGTYASSINFRTGGTADRLVLDASGNLGLGVVPSAWGSGYRAIGINSQGFNTYSITASSTGGITSNAFNNGTNWIYVNSQASGRYEMVGASHAWYTAPSGTAGAAITFTQAMTLDASGNLALGITNNPDSRRLRVYGVSEFDGDGVSLTVYKSSGTKIGSAGQGDYVVTGGPSNGYGIQSESSLVFGTGGVTERMRIGNTGDVWFNTASASKTADPGVKIISSATIPEIRTVVNTSDGGITCYSLANTNAAYNGYRFYVKVDGGIANVQVNNVNLSDRNAKKNIAPASTTWDCLKAWEIVNYRYKDQPDSTALNLGVIAQQVAESCPEVITVFQEAKEATEDQPAQEERLGVKEQQMYWMAIKALQEAQVRIETLEAKVAALEAS